MPTPSDLLTAAQVAEHKGVDRRTVTRWVEAGRLVPAVRLPGLTGALLFERSAVDAFTPPAEAAQS